MQKITFILLYMLAVLGFQPATAQTLDEVIGNYLTAMGGKEKMMSLNTVKIQGTLNVQGTDISIVVTRKHLVGSRSDISVMGTENYQIVTPDKSSVFMPVQGQSAPEAMPDDQLKFAVNQLDLQGPFINHKEKGTTVELVGKETVDGMDCNKLKVVFKNGALVYYFIDTKTNRICKTNTKTAINGEEVDLSTTYTNYKQNADGFWFPYTSTNMRGETNYDKIETNIAVDNSIFKVN